MKPCQVAKTLTCAAVLSVFALSACKPADQTAIDQGIASTEWVRPPSLDNAIWNGNEIRLAGAAEPNGRVVLAGMNGRVYAANAKPDGSFEIELNVPDQGLYLKPRSQIGQEFIDGHGLVFLKAGEHPVAVTLTDGEASYRLAHNSALEAVDSDGAMMIVSGHAPTTSVPRLLVDSRVMPVELDSSGHWAVILPAGKGPSVIKLGERTYHYPGLGAVESGIDFVSDGWRITRKIGDKAVQSTWLPVDR